MQAIYVRQSLDVKDSISIDTQIEHCKNKLLPDEPHKVYNDKGYSGKNTERPQFIQMMKDIENGEISRVVIYKLDRISRSNLDFANMMSVFEKYGVTIVSCHDPIDTSTPTGRAMLTVTMTFAQLERETIQQRITDNYYARAQKGFYIGGPAPFGYDKVETTHQGKKTKMLVENTEEGAIVRQMFDKYINGDSLITIARHFNDNNYPTAQGAPWSQNYVARILRNPVYCRANADVYNFLAGLGATMNNDVSDYIGTNGVYIYGDKKKRTGQKFVNLQNDYATVALHEGLISSEMWLNTQYILERKKNSSNLGTGNTTWLCGLVKCLCGYTLYSKKNFNGWKEYLYFYCRGKCYNTCEHHKKNVRVDKIEAIVEEALLNRLKELQAEKHNHIIKDSPEINVLKIQLAKIDEKINNLIERIADGEDITNKFLHQHIEKLSTERLNILNDISKLELRANKARAMKVNIDDVLDGWENYDIITRKKIAKEVIEYVVLADEEISIIFY